MKPTPKKLPPFDPKAKVALQIEFEPKDRAIFLRIAQSFESIAQSLEKIANKTTAATAVKLDGPSVSEPV